MGPSTVPCGMPLTTRAGFDNFKLTFIYCKPSHKFFSIKTISLSPAPKQRNLCKNFICDTVSKALPISIYVTCTPLLLFTAVVHSLRQTNKTVKIERPDKKPCYCVEIKLLLIR